jgi:DNA-binding transcriptional LysR family regulator
MESLNAIGVFVQAAEARSFVAAGRALGISASAVGKSVARLETRLGVRLFHRSTRSITLTSEGSQFLQSCLRILGELEEAQAAISQTSSTPQGRLRVSLPMVSTPFLSLFSAFRRRYPQVELDIDFTDRLVDIVEEGFDAVVRSGKPKDSRLSARRLGSFRMLVVAAPAYLAQHGTPQTPEDLARHACICFRFPHSGKFQAWALTRDGVRVEASVPRSLVCSSVEGRIEFALQGHGIAYAADFVIREELASGRLVQLLADFSAEQDEINLLWPSGRNMVPRLRAFIDFFSAGVDLGP